MPNTWIDANGQTRCHACGARWTLTHPKHCRASVEPGDQYPTTKIGTHENVYGYTVTVRKEAQK